MSEQQPKPPAGWYAHPGMANSLRYWDGEHWTDQVAPMQPASQRSGGRTVGPLVIAAGILIAALVIYLIYDFVSDRNEMDCLVDNADRSMNGDPGNDC